VYLFLLILAIFKSEFEEKIQKSQDKSAKDLLDLSEQLTKKMDEDMES
jgi:hypothetical protein